TEAAAAAAVEEAVATEQAAPAVTDAPPVADEAPAAEPAADDRVKGMPSGYEELTVAQVSEGAKTWNRPMLEAALAYEKDHAARKGAVAALESALKAKEEDA